MIKVIFTFVAFICAGLLAYSLTPAVRVFAFKIGAVDVPLDSRRIHKKPIPRIGGLAIYLSFLITTLLFCEMSKMLVTIWIGGFVLVGVGILDDVFRLNAWIKLLVQIAVAVFAVINGSRIEFVNIAGYIPLGAFSIPISIMWIVGLTNAINFIDGLDGLACGVSAISSFSLLLVVLLQGDTVTALICTILFGSCMGFLPFNSTPARIFMGDTGALFLGFTLSILSINGVFKVHAVLAFIVPLVMFALPIFDTLFAVVRRMAAGKSPFSPDRGHIHHRLIDIGFSQKESVRILYSICGILGLVSVFCTESMFNQFRVIRAVAIAIIAIAILLINFLIMRCPGTRRHSGLTDDDMTISEFIHELDPETARKIEMHNGYTAESEKLINDDSGESDADKTEDKLS